MADDLTLPTEEAVLTLIGKDNPSFTSKYWPYVTLGAPASPGVGKNTSMTIVGKPQSHIKGDPITLNYDRINLGVLDSTAYTPRAIPPGASVFDFMDVIIACIGMNLSPDDIEPATVQTAPPQDTYNTLQLTAKSGSKGYTGSHVLKVARPPHISTAFNEFVMPGF